jgi:hypothetical protein
MRLKGKNHTFTHLLNKYLNDFLCQSEHVALCPHNTSMSEKEKTINKQTDKNENYRAQ